ncbi:unnamed protein product [Ambrosiozyma monospora]|uniref:Dolichyl-diphosphooligosaccharide--protein glycosyltransferase subunit WBP1 n=1 Tax=Ambrosiozyma monospora TaxID=43982 RepID=A0A9W7DH15_AMBMO|nr:unnamed protein product [Ambrosiozyma monospora]
MKSKRFSGHADATCSLGDGWTFFSQELQLNKTPNSTQQSKNNNKFCRNTLKYHTMNFSSVFFTIACLFQLAFAIGPPTDFSKTLVIYDKDDTDFISEHSQFLSLLKSRSLDYEVKSTFDFDNKVFEHGQKLYQNIIVFPTHAKTIVDEKDFLEFSKKGGNLFIITDDSGIQTDVAIFLNQLGIYPSPKGYKYVDHHVKDSNVISKPNLKYLTNAKVDELAFNDGSVALLSNSELLIPVLQASKKLLVSKV